MPDEICATFEVHRLSILAEDGTVDEALMPALPEGDIRRMYEFMVLTRTFDQRAIALQREGRLGTYPPSLGQEAAQVGSAFALQPGDWLFPSFREMGVQLTLGYPIHQILQYWAGDERGQQAPPSLNIFPVCVSVGTHIPHAVGAAMAARYRHDPVAVAAWFGDGATSKGDFHEGFNMAGVFRLPLVFICQNNQWAISVPLSGQTASATLAQKAMAYGFEGVQVDGNDVFAVYRATRDALLKARERRGTDLYRVPDLPGGRPHHLGRCRTVPFRRRGGCLERPRPAAQAGALHGAVRLLERSVRHGDTAAGDSRHRRGGRHHGVSSSTRPGRHVRVHHGTPRPTPGRTAEGGLTWPSSRWYRQSIRR